MRHQVGRKKLGRTGAHRKALLRNLATALFQHERVETTKAKAIVLRSYAEKLITLGKRGDLHARRLAAAKLRGKDILQKLFAEISPRFVERAGGYTRIMKLGQRRGDNGERVLIELVERPAAQD